jgi:hypothetical protein
MAGITRRQLEDLRAKLGAGEVEGCQRCRYVYVIGAPGLFAHAYRGALVRTWQGPKLTRSEKLTHEEAREYKEGCPSCGRNVPTYPIVMRSPLADTRIPEPYPLRDWPDPPERLIWKAGNVYSDADRREA